MLERIKSVNNPLTIIALFAALAEIAGTVAIKLVAVEMQSTFIWFVMIFPTLIVVLFFITLNFNAKVLYAPSDFKNEENYLAVVNATQTLGMEKVQTMIATAKTEIISDVQKMIPANGAGDRNRVEEIVNEKFRPIQDVVGFVRDETLEKLLRVSRRIYTQERNLWMAERILTTLRWEKKSLTAAEIADKIGTNIDLANSILSDLVKAGVVKMPLSGKGGTRFALDVSDERTTLVK